MVAWYAEGYVVFMSSHAKIVPGGIYYTSMRRPVLRRRLRLGYRACGVSAGVAYALAVLPEQERAICIHQMSENNPDSENRPKRGDVRGNADENREAREDGVADAVPQCVVHRGRKQREPEPGQGAQEGYCSESYTTISLVSHRVK